VEGKEEGEGEGEGREGWEEDMVQVRPEKGEVNGDWTHAKFQQWNRTPRVPRVPQVPQVPRWRSWDSPTEWQPNTTTQPNTQLMPDGQQSSREKSSSGSQAFQFNFWVQKTKKNAGKTPSKTWRPSNLDGQPSASSARPSIR